jgi:phage regulator Rha-like protein
VIFFNGVKMKDLVLKSSNGNLVTNSIIIAELFSMPHKNILRALDKLKDKLKIEPISYSDTMNREQRMYELTERQALVAMPFIGGEKSVDGQIALVDAFIAMRKVIANGLKKQATLDWQEYREGVKIEYKIMSATLQEVRKLSGKSTAAHHYMNEAKLVNFAMTGMFKGINRNELNAKELQVLQSLEVRNAVLIGAGIDRDTRKKSLVDLYNELTINRLE